MLILNEGYKNEKDLLKKGKGSTIISNKKKDLDLTSGAGTILLGHNNKIFRDSLRSFLKVNASNFASPNIYAYKFIKILKKLYPQFSKFILCNSGAEANLKALRIVRAATNKEMIINVSGSWHGSVDQLLHEPKKNLRSSPISAGLDKSLKKNLVFIPYNDLEKSIKILNKYKKKIACVLVEPVQGGFP